MTAASFWSSTKRTKESKWGVDGYRTAFIRGKKEGVFGVGSFRDTHTKSQAKTPPVKKFAALPRGPFFSPPSFSREKAAGKSAKKCFAPAVAKVFLLFRNGARRGTEWRGEDTLLLLRFYACSHMANVLGHGYTT